MAYYVMYERAGSISLGHDSVATVALLSSRSDEHFKYWDLAGNSLPSSWSLQALGIIWESFSGHSSLRMSVGSRRESDICTCVSKVSQSLVGCPLQGVPWEVPLDWILDGVGALEELFTGLLALRPLRGVHVLIQQLPEVVWHVQDLEITGHPEKKVNVWALTQSTAYVTYWNPDLSLLDMLPKYSGSLITSQINFFWHSRSL